MRILVLSWYFPPINEIGALRVGRLAEFLRDQGHEIWVVTSAREGGDRSLCLDLPQDRVIRTAWWDVDRISSPWRWLPGRPGEKAPVPSQQRYDKTKGGFRTRLSEACASFVRIPDRHIGWRPFALRAGAALLKARAFDLIYASGPPFTAHLVAAALSRRTGVRWVAEYRDVWNGNRYIPKPGWRERLDSWLEKRAIATASGIVTATEPWAERYRGEFGKPTMAIYNGFDDANVSSVPALGSDGFPLTIAHMGTTYGGRRDPRVLFEAIKLAAIPPAELKVAFYGERQETILPLAEAVGVMPFITVPARVPYREALDIQRKSDVLLLLQTSTDWENIPAKLFEYFAAYRPILGLGTDAGVAARLIHERNAGFYETNVNAVATRLKAWVTEKRRTGRIAPLPESTSDGLSRREQLSGLDAFLQSLLHSPGSKPDATDNALITIR